MIEEYIDKTLGLDYRDKGSGEELVKHLPNYLKGAFEYSLVEIDGQEFLLLTPSSEVDMTTGQIVKFARQIEQQTENRTLVQFKSLDTVKRRVLINNKVNFVVVDKQIYIPSLRTYLNDSTGTRSGGAKEKLSPSAQLLLLYHLQKRSLEGLPFKDMAEVLGYSRKTISLVAVELQALSICEVEQIDAWNKVLRFHLNGRELWDRVLPSMTSPIHKIWHIDKRDLPADLPVRSSYDTALAHYTFIADSSSPSYAIDKKYQNELKPFLHPEEGDVRLDIWKYDPALLSDGQFVDKLSLLLCYKDSDDERVKEELTQMIDKIVW